MGYNWNDDLFYGRRLERIFLYNLQPNFPGNAGVLLILFGDFCACIFCNLLCKRKSICKIVECNRGRGTAGLCRCKICFWLNIGLTTSSIILYISLAIFAFQGTLREVNIIEGGKFSVVGLLAGTVITGMYQVIAIQQIRKKRTAEKRRCSRSEISRNMVE